MELSKNATAVRPFKASWAKRGSEAISNVHLIVSLLKNHGKGDVSNVSARHKFFH